MFKNELNSYGSVNLKKKSKINGHGSNNAVNYSTVKILISVSKYAMHYKY